MHIKWFATLGACLAMSAAQGQNFQINVFANGAEHPVIRGSTNLPDGTNLTVVLKKPWLPDGQQRIARGVPACEENCVPAEDNVAVRRGVFETKPFSFNQKPIRAGTYEVEVWTPARPSETLTQYRLRNPIFVGTVEVPGSSAARREPNAPPSTTVDLMPCFKYLSMYGTPESDEIADRLVDLVTGQGGSLGNAANIVDFVATECRLNERITVGQAVNNLIAQEKENRLPPIPLGGASADPKVEADWRAFEAWLHHQGPRPEL
jgi:hypothetical protein